MLSLTWVVTERNCFALTASLEADLAVMQGGDRKPTHQKRFSTRDTAHSSGCTITITKAKKETGTVSQAWKRVGQTMQVVAHSQTKIGNVKPHSEVCLP